MEGCCCPRMMLSTLLLDGLGLFLPETPSTTLSKKDVVYPFLNHNEDQKRVLGMCDFNLVCCHAVIFRIRADIGSFLNCN
jgi:hypothetical protein